MKNNKGFAPIAIVLIIIAVLVVGGIVYYVGTKNNSIPQNTQENNYQPQTQNTIPNTNPSSANKTFSETEIIASLKTNWQSIQSLIPFRPGHPSTLAWLSPDSVQFVGKNNLFVRFEDGYNPGIAVLNFDGSKFKILETFKNQGDFTLSDWQNLVKKYGDSSYPVSTYTISLLRNKEIVSFQDLTKVSENVFLKNYYVVSQADTSNWKTYSSVDFSLKYPATWYLNISSPGFVNITNYDSSLVPASDAPESPENIWINISVYPPGKYNNFSANETLESWVNKMGLSDKQNILVDGIKAIRGKIIYTGKEESGYFKKGESSGDYVMVVYNSKGYQISYSPYDSKFISTFDQILSTFKFTK